MLSRGAAEGGQEQRTISDDPRGDKKLPVTQHKLIQRWSSAPYLQVYLMVVHICPLKATLHQRFVRCLKTHNEPDCDVHTVSSHQCNQRRLCLRLLVLLLLFQAFCSMIVVWFLKKKIPYTDRVLFWQDVSRAQHITRALTVKTKQK